MGLGFRLRPPTESDPVVLRPPPGFVAGQRVDAETEQNEGPGLVGEFIRGGEWINSVQAIDLI